FNTAKLGHPDSGIKEEPQHQAVLHIFGLVHDLVEVPKLVSVENSWELPTFRCWAKLAQPAHLPGNVTPALVIQPLLADQASALSRHARLVQLRTSILCFATEAVFDHICPPFTSKRPVNF